MDEVQLEKNILDLKYQENLSLSNVLIGASLTVPPASFGAWVSFSGDLSPAAAIVIAEFATIVFSIGVLKRRRAARLIKEIRDLKKV